ncbi:UNVERIFIED_CONTAM: hypothetical protein DES50_1264 [Williamsia faeni]
MTRCPAGCHLLPHLAVPGHYERPTNWQLRHGRESWIRRSDQHHPQSTARRVAGHAATLVAGRYCTGTQRVRSSTQTTQRYSTPQTRITLPHCMIHRPSIAPTICKLPQPQVQNPSSVSSSLTGGTTFAQVRGGVPASNAIRTGSNTTPMLPTARRATSSPSPGTRSPLHPPLAFTAHAGRCSRLRGRAAGARWTDIYPSARAPPRPSSCRKLPLHRALSVGGHTPPAETPHAKPSAPSHVPQIISKGENTNPRLRHSIARSATEAPTPCNPRATPRVRRRRRHHRPVHLPR